MQVVQTSYNRQAFQQGKLKKEEKEKQKEMEEYLKDDETRIAKLKQIWKTTLPLHQKTLNHFRLYPILFNIIIYENL